MSDQSICILLALTLCTACSDGAPSEEAPPACDEECCECTLWCEDQDGDGYGSQTCMSAEQAPDDLAFTWVDNDEDCDDREARSFPGAAPLDDPSACMHDGDEDGWGAMEVASGSVVAGSDCDDRDGAAFPGAAELEQPADACMRDADEDGWGAWRQGTGPVISGVDCDDEDAELFDCAHCDLLVNPDAEQGTSAWTGRLLTKDFWNSEGKLVEPVSGDYFFIVGGGVPFFDDAGPLPPCDEDEENPVEGRPLCSARQTVLFDESLPADATNLLQLRAHLHVWQQDDMFNDTATARLSWLTLDDEELPCGEEVSSQVSAWTREVVECSAPSEEVKGMIVTLEGRHGIDSFVDVHYIDAYFDSLLLLDLSCVGTGS